MVSEDELLNVLKTTLQESGQFARLKADLSTQLMQALGLDKQLTDPNRPHPPLSVTLINELVREYLSWSGFKFTEMMFSAEAAVSAAPMLREDLCRQLNVRGSALTDQLPLLLTILSTVQDTKAKDQQ